MSSSQNVPLEDRLEGGYDFEFVGGLPSTEYTCLICSLVAREAQQVSCCGKIFCKQCLENSAKEKRSCPFCHEDLNGKYFPDKRAIHNINQFKVCCKNKQQGCTWEGELRRVETHHISCDYRQVQCPNQCTQAIGSTDLQQHLETECPNREVECGNCRTVGMYAYISTDHLETCPDLQIDCPNEGCQERSERRNMEAHRQQCPKETISCEYAEHGCEHACPREDMANHNESQMQSHLRLALNKLKALHTMADSRTTTPKVHIFKMDNFTKLCKKKECWSSRPFCAFPGGYKMCLKVYPGGYGDGKGTHISAILVLMAGENDDTLEWPMRGTFSIELLNQKEDQNHKECSVHFKETKAEVPNSRVSKGCSPCGLGSFKFVKHQELEGESHSSHTHYLKDDTLYFRVAMTEKLSASKPWLAVSVSS